MKKHKHLFRKIIVALAVCLCFLGVGVNTLQVHADPDLPAGTLDPAAKQWAKRLAEEKERKHKAEEKRKNASLAKHAKKHASSKNKKRKSGDKTADSSDKSGTPADQQADAIQGLTSTDISGWATQYAREVMGEYYDANNKKISKVINKGELDKAGVHAYIPYSDMAAFRGDEHYNSTSVGTKLATYLASLNYWGYITTTSGASQVSHSTGSFSGGIMHSLNGALFTFTQSIEGLLAKFQSILGQFLASFSPLTLLGLDKQHTMSNNFVGQAVANFFKQFGIDLNFFQSLGKLTLMIAIFVLGFMVLLHLTQKRWEFGKWGKGLLKIVVIMSAFAILGATGSITGDVGKILQSSINSQAGQQATSGFGVANKIVDMKLFAAGSNLSLPIGATSNGGTGVYYPESTADKNYVSDELDPTTHPNIVYQINQMGYMRLHQGKVPTNEELNQYVLDAYNSNSTYNVSKYAADIYATRGTINSGDISAYPKAFAYKQKSGGNGQLGFKVQQGKGSGKTKVQSGKYSGAISDIGSYCFAGSGNKEYASRKVEDFNSANNIGADNSPSNQSVVLLLQSSLDDNGATFYGYQLAPQSSNNWGTVPNVPYEASLVGHGFLGKLNSICSIICGNVALIMLQIGAMLALIRAAVWRIFMRMFKAFWMTIVTGNLGEVLSYMMWSIAWCITLALGVVLPLVLPNLIGQLVAGFNNIIGGLHIASSTQTLIALLGSFAQMYLAYLVAIKKS